MNKLVEINKEMTKSKHNRDEANSKLTTLKDEYRDELVNECAENLLKILEEENTLSKRDIQIYLRNLSYDLRNLYEIK